MNGLGLLRGSRVLLLAVGTTLVACGGSSEGGNDEGGSSGAGNGSSPSASPAFDSGLDGSQSVGSLSDDEYGELCSAYYEYAFDRYFGEAKAVMCQWQALLLLSSETLDSDAALRQQCQDYYDTCVELTPPPDGSASGAGAEICPARSATCSATVNEFEQCFSDAQLAFESALGALPSCSSVTLDELPVQIPLLGNPPSCLDYVEKCSGG
jgi:hypothetical protein